MAMGADSRLFRPPGNGVAAVAMSAIVVGWLSLAFAQVPSTQPANQSTTPRTARILPATRGSTPEPDGIIIGGKPVNQDTIRTTTAQTRAAQAEEAARMALAVQADVIRQQALIVQRRDDRA